MIELTRTPTLTNGNGQLMSFENDCIILRVEPGLTKIRIQCQADAEVDTTALAEIAGANFPERPKDGTGIDPSIFWRAPNEWLLVTPKENGQQLIDSMGTLLKDQTHALNDVSDSLAVIELSGEESIALLSEGCGIDVDPIIFKGGHYFSTNFIQLSTIIHRIHDMRFIFRIYVDRSEVLHLWNWFVDGVGGETI